MVASKYIGVSPQEYFDAAVKGVQLDYNNAPPKKNNTQNVSQNQDAPLSTKQLIKAMIQMKHDLADFTAAIDERDCLIKDLTIERNKLQDELVLYQKDECEVSLLSRARRDEKERVWRYHQRRIAERDYWREEVGQLQFELQELKKSLGGGNFGKVMLMLHHQEDQFEG